MLQSDLSSGPFRKGGQGGFLCNCLKSPFTKGGNPMLTSNSRGF